MTVHEFGDIKNPVLMLFPGTMCYWRGNFGGVIDELSKSFSLRSPRIRALTSMTRKAM